MRQLRDDPDRVIDHKKVDTAAVHAAATELGIDPEILPDLSLPPVKPPKPQPYTGWLSDREFALLVPHLPPRTRRNSIDYRELLDALLWKKRRRATQTQLPNYEAIRKQAERAAVAYVFDILARELPTIEGLSEDCKKELLSICAVEQRKGARIRKRRGDLSVRDYQARVDKVRAASDSTQP